MSRILIVEDETVVAMDIERGLRRLGYEVVGMASTGAEAVRLAEQTRPDLVLMDIRLRGPMDGIDAARGIRERLRAPVIFLTAYADDATLERAKQVEPFGYLLKPFEDRELHSAIEIALGKHRSEEAERERREAELRASEAREQERAETLEAALQSREDLAAQLKALLHYAPVGLAFFDRHHRYVRINGFMAHKMNGLPIEAHLDRPICDVLPVTGEVVEPILRRVFETGERLENIEVSGETPAAPGQQRYWLTAWFPVCTKDGKMPWVGAAVMEITQQKRTEQALQTAEKELQQHAANLEGMVTERTARLEHVIGELDAFSYSLSHDMRAPLRAIRSYSEIAMADCDEKARPLMAKVVSATERLDRMIQEVLSYAKLSRQEIRLETVDTDRLVREILAERPELQPPRAEVRVEGRLLPVLGHEGSLTQCVSNLLGNAVKFVAPGVKPQVRVWTEAVEAMLNCLDVGKEAQDEDGEPTAAVRLWVEDNGIGVAPEMREKLFEMFYRASAGYEGTGVGLAIVRRAVERMGGKAGVESQPGKGSRFWLLLPRGE